MNADDMDTFVFCLANKKSGAKMTKEMADLSTYCPEKRAAPEKYGIPAGFFIMSEIPEVTAAMLDSKMVAILNKYPELVDSVHFSDQVQTRPDSRRFDYRKHSINGLLLGPLKLRHRSAI